MAVLIQPAPPGRRFAAAIYDFLLLLALWVGAAFIAVLLRAGQPAAIGDALFQGALLGIALLFNAWFWTHGGQTLGMRAWRLQLRKEGGGNVSWGRAALRFLIAVPAWLCGVGVLWSLFHPERKTWQDLLSGTEMVLLPAPERPR